MRLAKRGCWRPCYSREVFLLFLLDKNDSLTFVITHKVEAVKENDGKAVSKQWIGFSMVVLLK